MLEVLLTICIDPAIDLPLQSPALNIRKHTKAEKNFSETQTKIQAVSDFLLTHSYLETRKRVIGKQCRPDQMSHNVASDHYVASDQGIHCLLTGFSIKNRIKVTN